MQIEMNTKRKIYVASSWRNEHYPEVVAKLREAGHDVYDFRNPPSGDPGFKWNCVSEDYMNWGPLEYRENLNHPFALRQFRNDIKAMESCDTCVLVLPCGRSAHTEAGWFAGRGKKVIAYIPEKQEPELMYKLFDAVCCTMDELTRELAINCDNTIEDNGFAMMAAEYPSRDIAIELAELQNAKGANFVRLLKQIASHGEFWPIDNDGAIFTVGGENSEDYPNLLNVSTPCLAPCDVNQTQTMLLFVRQQATFPEDKGRTMGYTYLGEVNLVKFQGSKPMEIVWKLKTPMPASFLKIAKHRAVG